MADAFGRYMRKTAPALSARVQRISGIRQSMIVERNNATTILRETADPAIGRKVADLAAQVRDLETQIGDLEGLVNIEERIQQQEQKLARAVGGNREQGKQTYAGERFKLAELHGLSQEKPAAEALPAGPGPFDRATPAGDRAGGSCASFLRTWRGFDEQAQSRIVGSPWQAGTGDGRGASTPAPPLPGVRG